MAEVVIEGKAYKCPKIVADEIIFLDSSIQTAIELAKKIESERDLLMEEVNKRLSNIDDLVRQLKDL